MKLSESVKKYGYFYFPVMSEQKMPGILSISELGEVDLDILGTYGDHSYVITGGSIVNSRIIGILETGEKVTIEGCFCTRITDNLGSFARIKICGNIALIGHEYISDEKIEFNRVTFSVNGLSEWLSISGIKYESSEHNNTAIKFEMPNDIHFSLEDGIQLSFVFELHVSHAFEDAILSQKVYISICSDSPKPLEDFRGIIFKLNNFFCLAIDNTVAINCLYGYSKDIVQDFDVYTVETPIHIYYKTNYSESDNQISSHNLLFRYEDVANCFENVLKLWFHNYSISEPAFNLYFSSKSGGYKYLEGKFLSLAQGIETLHKRNYPDRFLIQKDEFKVLKKSIVACCPDDRKKWLEERIKYGCELTLRERVSQLIEPFKELYGSDEQRIELISKIMNTRNYLTHYDPKLKEKSAQRMELLSISMKLESLFQLHFLRLVGLELDQIKNIVSGNYSLNEKLNNSSKE